MRDHWFLLALTTGALVVAGPTAAQTQPDAGRILQEIEPDEVSPTAPSVDIDTDAPALEAAGEEDGATIRLQAVAFEGNTVFSDAELRDALPDDVLERPRNLAGLRQLAVRITRHYRAAGYPFARAVLPPQELDERRLTLRILEGRYGTVTAVGDDEALRTFSEGFLSPLKPGAVIYGPALERTALLLGDQPGITVAPTLAPGEETGTGNLRVAVDKGQRFTGSVSLDNHGNRYSGEGRIRANLGMNRLFTPGDRLQLQGLYTEEGMWLGGTRYELPVGKSGLRGHVRYARSEYDLRAPFEGFTGTTDTAEAGLRYPFIRSRQSNLDLTASYRYQDLSNEIEDFEYDARTIQSLPVGMRFDVRDGLGGGGVSFGRATVTPGRVDPTTGGGLDGGFTKVHGQIARQQRLPAGWQAFARVRGQWADVPLPSAESLTLGGANGMRAYPQGEGTGSRGFLARTELRRPMTSLPGGRWTPFVFFDAGEIQEWEEEALRSIGGGGLGLRWQYEGWHATLAAAEKSWGGAPKSDTESRSPRVWGKLGYRF